MFDYVMRRVVLKTLTNGDRFAIDGIHLHPSLIEAQTESGVGYVFLQVSSAVSQHPSGLRSRDDSVSPLSFQRWVGFLVGTSLLCGGCAWRSGNTEHYWGPVLFRYAAPPQGKAYVSEQRHFVLLIESGRQWGISLGWKTRVAVAPQRVEDTLSSQGRVSSWLWSKPLSLFGGPEEGAWNLSLVYLRGERVPEPEFLSRSIYGVELGIGAETNALSLGTSRTTEARPHDNAMYSFRYDSRRPLETLFQVWEYRDGGFMPLLAQEGRP